MCVINVSGMIVVSMVIYIVEVTNTHMSWFYTLVVDNVDWIGNMGHGSLG